MKAQQHHMKAHTLKLKRHGKYIIQCTVTLLIGKNQLTKILT